MNLQIIKSMDGKIDAYHALRHQITEQLKQTNEDYEIFDPADYIDNPVALARLEAGITQEELAKLMNVTQAYISKIENQERVTAKMIKKIQLALDKEYKK